jgi:hypothetical protein
MTLNNVAPTSSPRKGEDLKRQDLGGRYGKIGIPAVAAAVAYQSDAKNQAYAPVVHRDDERRTDATA